MARKSKKVADRQVTVLEDSFNDGAQAQAEADKEPAQAEASEREQAEKILLAARAEAEGLTLLPPGKVEGNHTVELVEPMIVDKERGFVVCKRIG